MRQTGKVPTRNFSALIVRSIAFSSHSSKRRQFHSILFLDPLFICIFSHPSYYHLIGVFTFITKKAKYRRSLSVWSRQELRFYFAVRLYRSRLSFRCTRPQFYFSHSIGFYRPEATFLQFLSLSPRLQYPWNCPRQNAPGVLATSAGHA